MSGILRRAFFNIKPFAQITKRSVSTDGSKREIGFPQMILTMAFIGVGLLGLPTYLMVTRERVEQE